MKHIIVRLLAVFVIVATCGVRADAQQPGKIFRIGFLDGSTASGMAVLLEAFRQELSKLGWIEGKNIAIEYRFAEQKNERLPELAADLVRLKGRSNRGHRGCHRRWRQRKRLATIPIVMTNFTDPVGQVWLPVWRGRVAMSPGYSSLAPRAKYQKARDTQGRSPQACPSWTSRDCRGKRIILQLKELRPAAVALKLKLEEIETQPDAKGFESAFQTAKQKQVNAIMTSGRSTLSRRKKADRRACRQIPVAGYLLPEGVCR